MHTLEGHSGSVYSVAMDGDIIVSGSDDNTVKVWNVEGELLHILEGHSDTVRSVAMDGSRVVSGSDDKTVKVWNVETGELLHTLEGHSDDVESVAMNGSRVVSGSVDNTVKVWNRESYYSYIQTENQEDDYDKEQYITRKDEDDISTELKFTLVQKIYDDPLNVYNYFPRTFPLHDSFLINFNEEEESESDWGYAISVVANYDDPARRFLAFEDIPLFTDKEVHTVSIYDELDPSGVRTIYYDEDDDDVSLWGEGRDGLSQRYPVRVTGNNLFHEPIELDGTWSYHRTDGEGLHTYTNGKYMLHELEDQRMSLVLHNSGVFKSEERLRFDDLRTRSASLHFYSTEPYEAQVIIIGLGVVGEEGMPLLLKHEDSSNVTDIDVTEDSFIVEDNNTVNVVARPEVKAEDDKRIVAHLSEDTGVATIFGYAQGLIAQNTVGNVKTIANHYHYCAVFLDDQTVKVFKMGSSDVTEIADARVEGCTSMVSKKSLLAILENGKVKVFSNETFTNVKISPNLRSGVQSIYSFGDNIMIQKTDGSFYVSEDLLLSRREVSLTGDPTVFWPYLQDAEQLTGSSNLTEETVTGALETFVDSLNTASQNLVDFVRTTSGYNDVPQSRAVDTLKSLVEPLNEQYDSIQDQASIARKVMSVIEVLNDISQREGKFEGVWQTIVWESIHLKRDTREETIDSLVTTEEEREPFMIFIDPAINTEGSLLNIIEEKMSPYYEEGLLINITRDYQTSLLDVLRTNSTFKSAYQDTLDKIRRDDLINVFMDAGSGSFLNTLSKISSFDSRLASISPEGELFDQYNNASQHEKDVADELADKDQADSFINRLAIYSISSGSHRLVLPQALTHEISNIVQSSSGSQVIAVVDENGSAFAWLNSVGISSPLMKEVHTVSTADYSDIVCFLREYDVVVWMGTSLNIQDMLIQDMPEILFDRQDSAVVPERWQTIEDVLRSVSNGGILQRDLSQKESDDELYEIRDVNNELMDPTLETINVSVIARIQTKAKVASFTGVEGTFIVASDDHGQILYGLRVEADSPLAKPYDIHKVPEGSVATQFREYGSTLHSFERHHPRKAVVTEDSYAILTTDGRVVGGGDPTNLPQILPTSWTWFRRSMPSRRKRRRVMYSSGAMRLMLCCLRNRECPDSRCRATPSS